MAVHTAATAFFAVVEMDGTEVGEPDLAVELVEGELVAHLVGEVVASSEGMACVDADSHATFVIDSADDAGYLAEFESEVASLASGVLDNGGHALRLVEGAVDFLRNLVEAGLLAHLVEVTAWVEIEELESKLFATLHLIEECRTGLLKCLFVGVA